MSLFEEIICFKLVILPQTQVFLSINLNITVYGLLKFPKFVLKIIFVDITGMFSISILVKFMSHSKTEWQILNIW